MGVQMIHSAVILPTGDEIRNGTVLDTDSPEIMRLLLKSFPECEVTRLQPAADEEQGILEKITRLAGQYDLIVLIGGSGGGHRFSASLGKDFTHTAMEELLEEKESSEIIGYNGHLWSKLICGVCRGSLLINVPGPFAEASAAAAAFCRVFSARGRDLKAINEAMTQAVIAQYPGRAVDSFFMFSCDRREYPFAVAALCSKGEIAQIEARMKQHLAWRPTMTSDAVGLDIELAELVSRVCPEYVSAAAAIVKAWEEGPVSGGVIGDPHKNASSAEANLEELAPSLWSWAYPGKCGFIIKGTWQQGCQAVDLIYDCMQRNLDPWEDFKKWIRSAEIPLFLYASDASGKTGQLCAGNLEEIKEIVF